MRNPHLPFALNREGIRESCCFEIKNRSIYGAIFIYNYSAASSSLFKAVTKVLTSIP